MYNEYVAEGYRPEQAFFSKILQTYLLDRNKVPTIYNVSQVTSITITKPSKQVADGQSSNNIYRLA